MVKKKTKHHINLQPVQLFSQSHKACLLLNSSSTSPLFSRWRDLPRALSVPHSQTPSGISQISISPQIKKSDVSQKDLWLSQSQGQDSGIRGRYNRHIWRNLKESRHKLLSIDFKMTAPFPTFPCGCSLIPTSSPVQTHKA